MCEAPGNWIKCTQHYMAHFHPHYRYKWYANSLNPSSAEVLRIYGSVFKDELKYMAKYPEQWLFGADNTGDITRVTNIKNIAKRCGGVSLITGDAGLNVGDSDILALQKLEIAQLVMVLACTANGGCCIIKNFATSYSGDFDLMKGSIPYVASIIATYKKYFTKVVVMKPTTSNPLSGEYYLVGLGFKGITPNQLNSFYQKLDDFTVDSPIIEYKQDAAIENAIAQLYKLISKSNDMIIVLQECYHSGNNMSKECNRYLKDFAKFQRPLFFEWMKKNRYIPTNPITKPAK